METKFTPGPWSYDEDDWIIGPNGEDVTEYAGCGSHECLISNPYDKSLILASSDLYKALEGLIEASERADGADSIDIREAREVLAKARGER